MVGGQSISGRYRGAGARQLELRIDVGPGAPVDLLTGKRLECMSGDLFDRRRGELRYAGSFIARQVIRKSRTQVEGRQVLAIGAMARLAIGSTIGVTVRFGRAGKPDTAQVEFLDARGLRSASYTCRFVDRSFREVSWELVCVGDVRPFMKFDTGSKLGRIGVEEAFARAGLRFKRYGPVRRLTEATVLGKAACAGDSHHPWSDRELRSAMRQHFRSWRRRPQWTVCVLIAFRHQEGTAGLLFEPEELEPPAGSRRRRFGELPRQGCAVFSGEIDWSKREHVRHQLFHYVHEIGHCLNLPHSWGLRHGVPLLPQSPEQGRCELTWMNYPWNYVSPTGDRGEQAYWRRFKFSFTATEINHLRHAFRNDIIPGGNPFFGTAKVASAVAPQQVFEPRRGRRK